MFELEKLPIAVAVLVLAGFSGVASYLQGVREGHFERGGFNFIGEIATSVVAGVAILFLGIWQSYPEPLTCLFALVAASNGKEALSALSKMFFNKLNFNLGGKK